MPSAELLWQWLEARAGRTAVMAEWHQRADGCLSAVQGMLTPLDGPARIYPNPRGGDPLRVVHHEDDSIVAIDDSDWRNRLKLTPDDVIRYQLDLRALRTAICNALDGVNIAKTPVDQAARCLQIGNWEPKKAASFPVFLLLCANRRTLREQVLELQHRNRRPGAILLTPSRVHWSEDIIASARAGNMLLVPICEAVTFDSNRLVETDAWEEYLQAFAQMVKLTLPSNYRNKRPIPMRAGRAADIEKLEKAVEAHLRAARDRAYTQIDRKQEPTLLPKPEQQTLAKQCGLTTSAVSRCLRDQRAVKLRILWGAADSLESVLNFERRR